MYQNIERTLIEAERYINDLIFIRAKLRESLKDSKMQNYKMYYTLMKKVGHIGKTINEVYDIFQEMKIQIPYQVSDYEMHERHFYIEYLQNEANRLNAFADITKMDVEEYLEEKKEEMNKKSKIAYG